MADNTVLNTGSGGDTIASDEVTINAVAVKAQRVKLIVGADGVYDGDVSSSVPLPVDISDSATRDLGKVDIAAFDAALPAGTNSIGKLGANSGVDIGDVDVISCALPTGAATAAKQPALGIAGTPSADVISIQGITAMTPVTVDLGANNDVTVTSGTITETNSTEILADTASIDTNMATVAGDTTSLDTKIVTGAGTEAGAVRVTIATDSTGVLSVDDNGGALTVDNGGTFATQVDGAALTALQLIDDTVVTHDATVSAAGNQMMGSALTTNPTAVGTGDAVRIMCDDQGRVVTSPHSVRDLVGITHTALSATTSETTVVAAGGAGVFRDIVGITVHNGGAALNQVTIRPSTAGTAMFIFQLAADGGGTVFTPPVPIPQTTANNVWSAQCSVSGDVDITMLYIDRT